jgi:hypothetical protein
MKIIFIILWMSLGISTAYAQNPPPLVLPPSPVSPQAPAITLTPPPSAPGLEAYREPPAAEKSLDTAIPELVPPSATSPALTQQENVSPPPLGESVPPPLAINQPYDVAPPPLTLPGAPDALAPPLSGGGDTEYALPSPPALGTLDALAIPSDSASMPEKKEVKLPSWKRPLKPSHTPVETSHDYRRVTLPSTIYRESYDPTNRQLPTAQTNALYDHYFLLAVARDDLDGIRAMLANGYRDVNLFNAEGDTALIVAIRHNAIAAARLLIARGADPYLTGKGGFSAYDYARQLDNPELNAALEGIFG